MSKLSFGTLEILVNDYLIDNDWFTIDASLVTKENFKAFSNFHLEHHLTDKALLNFTIDDVSYSGSLGAFIYDTKYNIRLYMSSTLFNNSFSDSSAFQVNLPKILENHEKRLTVLTEVLQRNNLLNEDELLNLNLIYQLTILYLQCIVKSLIWTNI